MHTLRTTSHTSSTIEERANITPLNTVSAREILQRIGGELVELYPIDAPYAYVAIVKRENELIYVPLEPPLSRTERQVLARLKRILLEEFLPRAAEEVEGPEEEVLRRALRYAIRAYRITLPRYSLLKVAYYLKRDLIGYGKLHVLILDPEIEDISVPGVRKAVYVWHRRYENLRTTIVIESKEEIDRLLSRLATKGGKQISAANPIVDSTLPEGYRAHLVLGDVAASGGTITIRKYRSVPYTILELVNLKELDLDMAAYLWYLVENKKSIIIFGPTGAGKTTLLNAIAMFIRPEMKVLTIEETRELNLPHPHWVPLVTREAAGAASQVTLYDLVKSSLRQRPDYVIVGEIRGEEAYVFFQAIATGHGGMTTMHAESVDAAVKRLTSPPMNVPLHHIPLVDAFIHVERVRIRGRITRRVLEITEVVGIEDNQPVFNTVFRWTGEATDTFEKSAKSVVLDRIASVRGVPIEMVEREVAERKALLAEMLERDIRDYESLAKMIREFYMRTYGYT
ncbi:type II secretion system protein E [Pyrolobus fumarii 1A]|uniref:Type II secretion system protein E n=1 Tax=Pyrolobus fumarii (strain DSM 11204 / 1A) TaxID=694429 RepID=G0ECA0_PYRF1|nr:type II/IV secretion system ATPase subunit [Pyrolobus fumarii]AEM39470.1 type II secretion system protein E [Pyrolobus fumarii 1A]